MAKTKNKNRVNSVKKKSKLKIRNSRFGNKFALLGVVLLTAVIGAKLLLPGHAATGGFVKIAVHPQAIQQAGAGQPLRILQAWDGKIWAGYGDWINNTGPIAITPFDPATGTFAAAPSIVDQTEAIERWVVIGDKLYAPSADPRGGFSTDFAVGTASGGSGPWSQSGAVGMTHAFDMATLTGTDLWLVGSQVNDAVIYRSLDGGATWQSSYRISGTERKGLRFYGVAAYNGKLYAQVGDSNGVIHSRSVVFDGTSWSSGPALGALSDSATFAGKLISRSGYFVGSLMAFDGTTQTTAYANGFLNYAIDGDTIYVLDGYGNVKSSKDLVNWNLVTNSAPATAHGIAVINGQIYLGGSDSAIYKYDPSFIDSVPPATSIVAPSSGTIVSGNSVKVVGSASDSVRVNKMELYIDGKLVSTSTTTSVGYSWSLKQVSAGAHTILVKAYDPVGNVGQSSETVSK
jgi:hypothetical protein